MKVTKRNFNVTIKLTKDYDSVGFTEGFELEFDEFEFGGQAEQDFENEKRKLSQKVYRDVKDFIGAITFDKTDGLKTKKVDLNLDFKSGDEHGKGR